MTATGAGTAEETLVGRRRVLTSRSVGTVRRAVILFLHNRYRVRGGEERVVEDQAWLVREHLGEEAQVLERDSAAVGRRAAALGCCAAGSTRGRRARRSG